MAASVLLSRNGTNEVSFAYFWKYALIFCLVFSMKDDMVYNVIPNLHDWQALHFDKLFSNASTQDPQIIHPNVIMRDQPFEIVALVPPSCGGTSRSIAFCKDGSIWCDKMQKYQEFFTIPMGGYAHRCTVGKEFWDNCPLDTDKIGLQLRYTDSWGSVGYLISAEVSIGAPGTIFNHKFEIFYGLIFPF